MVGANRHDDVRSVIGELRARRLRASGLDTARPVDEFEEAVNGVMLMERILGLGCTDPQ